MTAKTKTSTNGHVTPAELAQSAPETIPLPEPLREALLAKYDAWIAARAQAEKMVKDAQKDLDDLVELTNKLVEHPAGYQLTMNEDRSLCFAPRPAS